MGQTVISSSYKIVTSIEDNKWDEFVFNHPHGNIFQTHYMYEVYRNTKKYHPIKMFVVNQGSGRVCGVLLSVIINEVGGLLTPFSSHCVIQGGPLILPGEEQLVLPMLLSAHDKAAKKKALYGEIRNVYDFNNILRIAKDYVYEDHLNYLIRLDQSEELLWRNLHRAKRNHINKATKMNIEIREITGSESLPEFYGLIKETYKKAKIPLADISLFKSAYDVLAPCGMVKYFFATYNNINIGAQAFLLYKDRIFAWYLGAAKEYLNYHPNEYLTWYILKWGKCQGFRVFDFGGAGKPGVKYGPRDYKREFGGDEVNYGRHKKIYKPLATKITDTGFRLYQKVLSLNR